MSDNISLDMGLDADKALLDIEQTQTGLDKPVRDSMAAELTSMLTVELKNSLQENGSVVSGRGLNSIMPIHLDDGRYGIQMKQYLEYVDKGTPPHHPPVRNNHRFQTWAEQNGIDPHALARSIARKGTQAHPFMDRAVQRFNSRAREVATDELENMLTQ